jgi:hypothetical protein
LNPVADQVAKNPETIKYTSIKQRLDHVEARRATVQLEAAMDGSVAISRAAAGFEESPRLCPNKDRRELDWIGDGMMQGLSLARTLGRS